MTFIKIETIDSVQFTGDEILFRSTLKRHLTQDWNYSCDKNGSIEKKVNGWDKLLMYWCCVISSIEMPIG